MHQRPPALLPGLGLTTPEPNKSHLEMALFEPRRRAELAEDHLLASRGLVQCRLERRGEPVQLGGGEPSG